MHIASARLASFCHSGVISDPLIVTKFSNEIYDPKGQEKKSTLETYNMYMKTQTCLISSLRRLILAVKEQKTTY